MSDKPSDLARNASGVPGGAATVRRGRQMTDKLLADSTFDRSLGASRQRLLDALAIGSEVALRLAENGLTAENAVGLLKDMSSVYRQLVASDDPTEQRPGETEEAYRLRLEAAAR